MRKLGDILGGPPARAGGADPDPPAEETVCPACNGAGFVGHMVPVDHPDFGKAFPCEACRPAREAERRADRLLFADLPHGPRYPMTFETWQPRPEAAKALAAAKAFAQGKAPHPFLTLIGGYGTGKTHLAVAAAHAWITADRGAGRYFQVERLLDEMRAGYDRDAGASAHTYCLLDSVIGVSILVLDDLGAQKGSDWATAKLDEIIDARWANGRPTIITTNLPIDKQPGRIADRLIDGQCIVLTGESYRRTGGGAAAAGPSWRRKGRQE